MFIHIHDDIQEVSQFGHMRTNEDFRVERVQSSMKNPPKCSPYNSGLHEPSIRGPFLNHTRNSARTKILAFTILAFTSVIFATDVWQSKTGLVDFEYARNLFDDPRHVDCSISVPHPIDSAPIRSPQKVHSIIAAKAFNRTIVEIGTRNGDGMACFAKYAKSASAIEYDETYCKRLEQRASSEIHTFKVLCQDFYLADLDADFITWWQQSPLTNVAVLARLKQLKCSGQIRPVAEAILLFDMKWPRDMRDFLELKQWFSWHEEAQFDELDACERFRSSGDHGSKETGFSCDRSQGKFITAGMPVVNIPDSILTC